MSPRRPRRRARRRSPARPITLLIAAVIVLALLVGGLTQVSRQSQGYDANSDRSLAAQGTVVADQSNATSSTVRTLIDGLQSQSRQGLQAELDERGATDGRRIVTGQPGRRQQPSGLGGHRVLDRLRREGPVHDAAACCRRRVPRYAPFFTRRGATRRRGGRTAQPPCSRRPRRRTASLQPAHSCPVPMLSTSRCGGLLPPPPAMAAFPGRCG